MMSPFKINTSDSLLLMKFSRDVDVKSRKTHFIEFTEQLLLNRDREWDESLNIIMQLKEDTTNLRMTVLEI